MDWISFWVGVAAGVLLRLRVGWQDIARTYTTVERYLDCRIDCCFVPGGAGLLAGGLR